MISRLCLQPSVLNPLALLIILTMAAFYLLSLKEKSPVKNWRGKVNRSINTHKL